MACANYVTNMPSWKVEPKYSPKVLIGNWVEERCQYPKIKYNHTTTYRNDYKHYGYRKPDVTVRRAAAMRDFGLSRQFLLNHLDGNKYTSNLVSNYDEFYNGRWRENTQFPQLRTWNKHTLKFVPEKSDFPLLHGPTNFGLYPKKVEKWAKQKAEEDEAGNTSTYQASYKPYKLEAVAPRCANPKSESSSTHKYNNTYIQLRNVRTVKLPEKIDCNLADIVE